MVPPPERCRVGRGRPAVWERSARVWADGGYTGRLVDLARDAWRIARVHLSRRQYPAVEDNHPAIAAPCPRPHPVHREQPAR